MLGTAQVPEFETEGSSSATQLERRWFAAQKHVETLSAECEILREVMLVAQANWREANSRLTSMQALCAALSNEFPA